MRRKSENSITGIEGELKKFPFSLFSFFFLPHRVFQNMEDKIKNVNLERICKIYFHNNMEEKFKKINLEIDCKSVWIYKY